MSDQENTASSSEAAPSPEQAPPKAAWRVPPWMRRWAEKLHWKAHWWLPNIIRSPFGDAAFQEARDERDNAESRVPEDAQLRSTMVWGVELYGPSEIEGLYASMDRLGWSGIGARTRDDSAAQRIRQQRANGAGGWLNLGHVRPPGGTPNPISDNVASLPMGVSSLSVKVFQVTRSLTAVIVAFCLTDGLAGRYAAEINRPRKSYFRRSARQRAIEWVDPVNQKHEAISRVRADFRSMAGLWLTHHLPGYFAGLGRPADFPTMELLALRGPLFEQSDSERRGRKNRQWMLAGHAPHEVWTYKDDQGLQFAIDRSRDWPSSLHFIAALDTTKFPKDKAQFFGGDRPESFGWYCNEVLDGMLVHAATAELMRVQLQDLSQTRDRMKWARSGMAHVERTLDEIGDFFDLSLGSSVIARELAAHSEDLSWYRHDCANFSAPGLKPEGERQLPESFREWINALARQMSDEEAALRAHFEQLSTVLSVRESINAQKWMSGLTVLALVVAIASLVVAVQSSDRASKWVENFLGLSSPAPDPSHTPP